MKKERFEVSTLGMRQLQSGREPWQLAKELVSNAWDEHTANQCKVTIESVTPRQAKLTVFDNGNGFSDIADAYTLMGYTPKRADPMVRGRFNIGEKEILSVALKATIATGNHIISFPRTGGRIVRKAPVPYKGTTIICTVPWGPRQVETVILWLSRMLPPATIEYTVNGNEIAHREPFYSTDETLETIIESNEPGKPMRASRRNTTIKLYKEDDPLLYEMGVPVQTIDCPYSVNVLQKVPLPPNRDMVKDSFLKDVYAVVLNATIDDIQDPSATWVRTAVEDKLTEPEVVKNVMTQRYGKNVVLWSSDQRANEKAMSHGYSVVHAKTLSNGERERFGEIGLQHSSSVFPTNYVSVPDYPREKWTPGMVNVAEYSQMLAKNLPSLGVDINVFIFSSMQVGEAASYGNRVLNFNIARLGKAWFNEVLAHVHALILHELSHHRSLGKGHEHDYYKALEKLTGEAVQLALEKPTLFKPFLGAKS